MSSDVLPVLLGSAACAAGVAGLRVAWGRPRRSASLNALAWSALIAGLAVSGWADAAWGMAVGATVAMLTAAILLAAAATQAGNGKRPDRDAASSEQVPARSGFALGRRTAVFLLVVPGGFAAAVLIALAGLALARQAGWVEADAITIAFYLFPIAWTTIVLVLMFGARLRTAFAQLAGIAAAAAGVAWVLT